MTKKRKNITIIGFFMILISIILQLGIIIAQIYAQDFVFKFALTSIILLGTGTVLMIYNHNVFD